MPFDRASFQQPSYFSRVINAKYELLPTIYKSLYMTLVTVSPLVYNIVLPEMNFD